MKSGGLNPLAQRLCDRLVAEYPAWEQFVDKLDEGDLELAVPAPPDSKAGHLVVFTSRGKDIWVRFGLPRMCYAVDDLDEMISVTKALLAEQALFVVIMKRDE